MAGQHSMASEEERNGCKVGDSDPCGELAGTRHNPSAVTCIYFSNWYEFMMDDGTKMLL